MKIYFAVLKSGVSYSKVENATADLEIKILQYYPKLDTIKFETDKKLQDIDITSYFKSIEEEKDDFSI